MSLEYFEGPAGSGKTFNIIAKLKSSVESRPLGEHEGVLGLTYMHGSRRRMHDTLAKVDSVRGRFHACTIDSFARSIVHRWRTLARTIDGQLKFNSDPDFERVCRVGAVILRKPVVASWVAARYPFVLVDELQDCKGDHLDVVRALESHCHVIAAADEFQDLNSTGPNEAIEWLHTSTGKRNILTVNRRTTKQVLLTAASRLRASARVRASAGAGSVRRSMWDRRASRRPARIP